jgi:hypothetical protein
VIIGWTVTRARRAGRVAVSRSALPRIALLALIWGSAFLWIKLADRGFSPVEVTLARLALGSVVLFAIMRTRRETIPRSARLWAHIAVAVTRRRRPGFNPGASPLRGGPLRRVLRTQALRRGGSPRTAPR